MMFLLTQLYGLTKSKLAVASVFAAYGALGVTTYSGGRGGFLTGTPVGWADIPQITWIPVILYGLVFVLAWLFAGVAALLKKKKA